MNTALPQGEQKLEFQTHFVSKRAEESEKRLDNSGEEIPGAAEVPSGQKLCTCGEWQKVNAC